MNPESPKHRRLWLREGLLWAAFMYPTISLLLPLAMGDDITWRSALIPLPIWLLAGAGYGYTTRKFFAKAREDAWMSKKK